MGMKRTASYGRFAAVYDLLMSDIPYNKWAGFVIGRLKAYGVSPQESTGTTLADRPHMLELGCGTGNMSRWFCMEGYRVTGIDLSESMIREARKKLIPDFEAYVGDMRLPFLPKGQECDCIVSLCDSMNYLTSKADLELTMKACAMQLKAGGLFIFDLKTDAFYREYLGDNIFADSRNKAAYIWVNHYDANRHINYYDITFFYRFFGGLYRKFTEHHLQRAYSRAQITRIAHKYGFTVEECTLRGEREYYVLRNRKE